MTERRGPYVQENGPKFYLPVADWSYHEARSEAAAHAQSLGHKSRYLGKEMAWLHDHDEPWPADDACNEVAYAFEEYE